MTLLNTHHWARETEQILAMARQALSESRSPDIRDLVQRLPINVQAGERPISLVFAGQYSSGKSTLLKALTGRDDIATGAGITTEEAHSYEWEGVTVIDTPGIHTSLRPDHDATSYEAISNADLMVFVITNELFDSHLGHHYRKLTEVGWEKWTPKSDKLERRRCQDEEGPARKVYQGIPAGSSEAGIGRESVIARGRASVVLTAIDVGVLGEAI